LQPLADSLLADPTQQPETLAQGYLNAEAGVADTKAALDGARAILIEQFAEDAELLGRLREKLWNEGELAASVVAGKEQEGAKFADYFDHREAIRATPSHRAWLCCAGAMKVCSVLR
jgi:uncharacterized protein